jgi:hypothetical protein
MRQPPQKLTIAHVLLQPPTSVCRKGYINPCRLAPPYIDCHSHHPRSHITSVTQPWVLSSFHLLSTNYIRHYGNYQAPSFHLICWHPCKVGKNLYYYFQVKARLKWLAQSHITSKWWWGCVSISQSVWWKTALPGHPLYFLRDSQEAWRRLTWLHKNLHTSLFEAKGLFTPGFEEREQQGG